MYVLGLKKVGTPDAKSKVGAIKKSVNKVFKTETADDLLKQKMVAFGADGASVNTGQKAGVIAILRSEISPVIVMVKCLAHRIELAYKDGMKPSKIYSKVTTLLSGVYAFYHKSGKQRTNLEAAYDACFTSGTCVFPIRIGGTRWVTHTLLAIEKLWKIYPALVLHMNQVINLFIQH